MLSSAGYFCQWIFAIDGGCTRRDIVTSMIYKPISISDSNNDMLACMPLWKISIRGGIVPRRVTWEILLMITYRFQKVQGTGDQTAIETSESKKKKNNAR